MIVVAELGGRIAVVIIFFLLFVRTHSIVHEHSIRIHTETHRHTHTHSVMHDICILDWSQKAHSINKRLNVYRYRLAAVKRRIRQFSFFHLLRHGIQWSKWITLNYWKAPHALLLFFFFRLFMLMRLSWAKKKRIKANFQKWHFFQ